MINGGIQFKNAKEFSFALRAYKAATRKDMADILNRAARNVAYRAAQATPATSSSQIRQDLNRDAHLRYALTSIALRKRGIKALKKGEFRREVARFVSRRASSGRYLRAAYAQAVQQLGGTFRGAKFRGADGFANKASAGRLLAEIVAIASQPDSKHATSAENVAIVALNAAVAFVAADMLTYANQKLAQTAAEHSG